MDFRCGCPVQGHLAACRATWYTDSPLASLHAHTQRCVQYALLEKEADQFMIYMLILTTPSLANRHSTARSHHTSLSPGLLLWLPEMPFSQVALTLPASTTDVIPAQDRSNHLASSGHCSRRLTLRVEGEKFLATIASRGSMPWFVQGESQSLYTTCWVVFHTSCTCNWNKHGFCPVHLMNMSML